MRYAGTEILVVLLYARGALIRVRRHGVIAYGAHSLATDKWCHNIVFVLNTNSSYTITNIYVYSIVDTITKHN